MDIFSHALWIAAAGKEANDLILKPKAKKPLKLRWLVFWGIFPDIFSFTIPFVWLLASLVLGNLDLSNLPKPENMEPAPSNHFPWAFQIGSMFYSFSHSLVIFSIIFAMVFLILRRPVWEMSGWLLHILIDIPTHSYQFYATPFLWPVSGWKFNGFYWASPKFLIINFSLLIIVYLFLWIKRKKSVKI